jgi:hypothetical protein
VPTRIGQPDINVDGVSDKKMAKIAKIAKMENKGGGGFLKVPYMAIVGLVEIIISFSFHQEKEEFS